MDPPRRQKEDNALQGPFQKDSDSAATVKGVDLALTWGSSLGDSNRQQVF